VNVANPVLARSASRWREIGMRLAVGVDRLRLIRQLLTENVLLAATSGFIGLVVAYAY
jgi:ABC-type antimicrobial peptide transport system permease subunit